jgi:hypothetical protein
VTAILSRLRRVSNSRDDSIPTSPNKSPSYRTDVLRHNTPPQKHPAESDSFRNRSPHGIKFHRSSSPPSPPIQRSSSPTRDNILKKYKDEVRAVKEHTNDLMLNVKEKISQMDVHIKESASEIRNLQIQSKSYSEKNTLTKISC